MPQNENRPPRVSLRPALNKQPSRLSLRATKPKPKPLDTSKPSGNISRPQLVGSAGGRTKILEPARIVRNATGIASKRLTSPPPPRMRGGELISTLQRRETSNGYTHGTDADDEESDLEDKIRSALTSPGAHRITHTPGSAKSVRFDPAIVSFGRVTSGTTPKTPFEQALEVSPPVSPSPMPKKGLQDVLQSLSQLKKTDQRTLRKVLEALKDITSDSESTTEPVPKIPVPKSSAVFKAPIGKKLNPQAPSFQEFSGVRPQEIPRKLSPMAELFTANKSETYAYPPKRPAQEDPKEPSWVNAFNPPAPEDMPDGLPVIPTIGFPVNTAGIHASSASLVPQMVRLPVSPAELSQMVPNPSIDLSGQGWQSLATSYRPLLSGPYSLQGLSQQAIWLNPIGFETPSLYNQWVPRRTLTNRYPHKRPMAANGPLVDVMGFVPPEFGHGRVAQAIDHTWSRNLLDTFSTKYPQTGKAQENMPAPSQMRQAAAIQQQLEFLIYQEKEKKAFQERTGHVLRASKGKVAIIEKSSADDESPTIVYESAVKQLTKDTLIPDNVEERDLHGIGGKGALNKTVPPEFPCSDPLAGFVGKEMDRPKNLDDWDTIIDDEKRNQWKRTVRPELLSTGRSLEGSYGYKLWKYNHEPLTWEEMELQSRAMPEQEQASTQGASKPWKKWESSSKWSSMNTWRPGSNNRNSNLGVLRDLSLKQNNANAMNLQWKDTSCLRKTSRNGYSSSSSAWEENSNRFADNGNAWKSSTVANNKQKETNSMDLSEETKDAHTKIDSRRPRRGNSGTWNHAASDSVSSPCIEISEAMKNTWNEFKEKTNTTDF
ncbi:hypothetical protein BGZ60DRAFT_522205 [Tricladium varicosporioides]|nr:hypothetical protein BGZ60DRAFT_522205 [Hymenoscyphus varicosporioides]